MTDNNKMGTSQSSFENVTYPSNKEVKSICEPDTYGEVSSMGAAIIAEEWGKNELKYTKVKQDDHQIQEAIVSPEVELVINEIPKQTDTIVLESNPRETNRAKRWKAKKKRAKIKDINEKNARKKALEPNRKKPERGSLQEELKGTMGINNSNELVNLHNERVLLNQEMPEKLTPGMFDSYEKISENLDMKKGFTDFAIIISEGGSVSGQYFQDAFLEYAGDYSKKDIEEILKKIDTKLDEYDKNDSFHRVSGYDYEFSEDGKKLKIGYGSCNGTSMDLFIDFENETTEIDVWGNVNSVMRRIQSTGEASNYITKGDEYFGPFFDSVLQKAEEFSQNGKINYDVHYGTNIDEYGKLIREVYFSPLHNLFDGYQEELGIGDKWSRYPGITLYPEDNKEEKMSKYVEKTEKLFEKKQEIERNELKEAERVIKKMVDEGGRFPELNNLIIINNTDENNEKASWYNKREVLNSLNPVRNRVTINRDKKEISYIVDNKYGLGKEDFDIPINSFYDNGFDQEYIFFFNNEEEKEAIIDNIKHVNTTNG